MLHFRQTSHGITQLTAPLGRTGVGSTVISRFVTDISAGPPQMCGAKPFRRCGLLGSISLLSPAYLLYVELRQFHASPQHHYDLISHLLDLSVSQSSSLMLSR